MVDKKFRIHRDEFARVCGYKSCAKEFRTFVRTQEYCCVRCRYEHNLELSRQREAEKAARRTKTEQILAEQKAAKRLKREEAKLQPKKKSKPNNTPHKLKFVCGEVKMRRCLGKFCDGKEFLTDAANRICPSCTHRNNNAIAGPDEYRVIVDTRKTGSNY